MCTSSRLFVRAFCALFILGSAIIAVRGVGPGPVLCSEVNSCGAGFTCCPAQNGPGGEWACCAAPNATCCADMLHCCPQDFPVCGQNGTCTKRPGADLSFAVAAHTAHARHPPPAFTLGRAPPPPPPPPLYPFECTSTRIGCFAEEGRQGDGWPSTQRFLPRRPWSPNATMAWGQPMSVEACARFCHQGMTLVDWVTSPYNVSIAGNRLCGCSVGVPAVDDKTGLPKRVDDALCSASCPAGGDHTCGDENQTVVTAYAFSCHPVQGKQTRAPHTSHPHCIISLITICPF